MKYLIIDKKQRVKTPNADNIATASVRLMEELDKKNIPYTFAHFDELEFKFLHGETEILAKGEDIKEYTHILFRGHDLHNEMQYHFKRYIVDYIDNYNLNNQNRKILVQNSKTIKKLPYYNKIELALFCSKHNIPYFNSYYKTDGNYLSHRNFLNSFPLIMKDYSGKNRVEIINGEEKIKKNVFMIINEDGYRKGVLKDSNLSRMFIQEFSPTKMDMRIFVKMGKVIGGWKREAKEGFMTVSKGEYSMYNKPESRVAALVENVARLLEADFVAVDVMMHKKNPLLQEISLHPGFKAYETKIEGKPANIAKEIITAFPE
jgi:glutathione synthase/RimK-type ligase-like ATP-grasp enzyme